MKRKISAFAIMACLASSLAFAGDKAKSKSSAECAQPAAAASDNATKDNNSPCVSTNDKNDKKKDKKKAKPAPSDQEQQFDKVLQGIYG